MTREDILQKLEKLITRLLRHRRDNYHNTILKEEDRLDFKKDLDFAEHAIKIVKGVHIPDFSNRINLRQLNKVWKKYKPKEYVAHA